MNLPKVVADLVETQNNFDSVAYANCFSETAVVFDEGKTHNGKKEIERWIADSNERYKATIKPVGFEEKETESLLMAETSGNFEGSPIVLTYHLEIVDELIQTLKVTG
ncbi:nuclear transport factor 2 family protein [Dyadobacter chenwenxiniae]|uniref:Nuclear transport factor 2 family protein n=1 Tax=Dyadobacter chenwenxiniae TaxID=2906456 RepID=A0A9X1PTK4_9BACT|nr:nuclear transport factor 2 family protein [Dyadobacter chenwenxiniae]MCF0065864.1 nuclear transport factor 2 family protein [Dyadobacter chenwenxiniae]UON84067.1 nuclear transport factor 2 family protein [Dyadobacter chenwenxiniae]